MNRRTARADAAHAARMAVERAPARWICRVSDCDLAGHPQAATSTEAAERAAMAHYDRAHATPPPDDLEEQRAAWIKAGRPPLGEFDRKT